VRDLERRLARLEARATLRTTPNGEDLRAGFFRSLLQSGARLVAAGDLPDESQMSVAERAGVALVTGEYEKACQILAAYRSRAVATPHGGRREV
jgi:hypothetical protein